MNAHFALLSVLWPKFEKFELTNIPISVLTVFLEFLYTGKLNTKIVMPINSVFELDLLIQLVTHTERPYLIQRCNITIFSVITTKSVVELLKLSILHNYHSTTQNMLLGMSTKALKSNTVTENDFFGIDPQIMHKLLMMLMKLNVSIDELVSQNNLIQDDTCDCILKIHNFTDFSIKIDKTILKINRLLLAISSGYFRTLLRHDMVESQNKLVDLSESKIDVDTWISLIRFFNTRNIYELGNILHLIQLYDESEYYQLPLWMETYILISIKDSITPHNALLILEKSSNSSISKYAADVLVKGSLSDDFSNASPEACKYILLSLLPIYKKK